MKFDPIWGNIILFKQGIIETAQAVVDGQEIRYVRETSGSEDIIEEIDGV